MSELAVLIFSQNSEGIYQILTFELENNLIMKVVAFTMKYLYQRRARSCLSSLFRIGASRELSLTREEQNLVQVACSVLEL